MLHVRSKAAFSELGRIIHSFRCHGRRELAIQAFAWRELADRAVVDLESLPTTLFCFNSDHLLFQLFRSTDVVSQLLDLLLTVLFDQVPLVENFAPFAFDRCDCARCIRFDSTGLTLDPCALILLVVHLVYLCVHFLQLCCALSFRRFQQMFCVRLFCLQLTHDLLQFVAKPRAIRVLGNGAKELRILLSLRHPLLLDWQGGGARIQAGTVGNPRAMVCHQGELPCGTVQGSLRQPGIGGRVLVTVVADLVQ
mmetsp:Transcript_54150/g.144239  ORF Transcript_54150/g.144239 Transcript_54150/m.144239 type:complete len:252 (-) Transcript_54150:1148-1903(-)